MISVSRTPSDVQTFAAGVVGVVVVVDGAVGVVDEDEPPPPHDRAESANPMMAVAREERAFIPLKAQTLPEGGDRYFAVRLISIKYR